MLRLVLLLLCCVLLLVLLCQLLQSFTFPLHCVALVRWSYSA